MARRATEQPRPARDAKPPPRAALTFAFLGFRDGWYALRAGRSARSPQHAALAFEGRVVDWLVSQRITPGQWSHLGSGNTGDYPVVPDEDGGALWLLLKRPADVLRLSAAFPCAGVTQDALMAAVQAEARVHRFVLEDAAKVAHDAIRRLALAYGDSYPSWDDLDGERRVDFLLQVRRRGERPDEPVPDAHQAWVAGRVKDGWKYAASFSQKDLTDPLVTPWGKLGARAQASARLLAAVVASLAPLLDA